MKEYDQVRWRVDSKNILYVYDKESLLFTKRNVFELDDDLARILINEELGDDTWKYAYERDDGEVDDASDEPENEDAIDFDKKEES